MFKLFIKTVPDRWEILTGSRTDQYFHLNLLYLFKREKYGDGIDTLRNHAHLHSRTQKKKNQQRKKKEQQSKKKSELLNMTKLKDITI